MVFSYILSNKYFFGLFSYLNWKAFIIINTIKIAFANNELKSIDRDGQENIDNININIEL